MLRIWPLYFFFLGMAFALSNYRSEFDVGVLYYLALLLLVGNFAFAGWNLPSSISHLWSICVEEQFYLLWPPVVRKVSRPRLVRVAMMLIGISVTARLGLWMIGIPSGQAVSLNTFAHLDPIAGGILLPTVPRNKLAGLALVSRIGLAVFALACWSLVSFSYYSAQPVAHTAVVFLGYPAIALGCAAFMVAALEAGKSAGFMLSRRLIYLGRISYGLYIYHRLAISLTLQACAAIHGECDTEGLLMRTGLSFAGTVLLAAVSYRLLESPFLRLKRRFTHVPSRPV
jgi:peptidoglycan/LPS O-acetylase OafA/YrhL